MEGAQIGPYRVLGDLGSGGMGKVYLAEVTGHAPGLDVGSRVALKVIHPHLLETPGFFKRFLREAEIGKSVEQDNVVRCFDCDALLVDGHQQHYLVMEYVEGQTLRDLLSELECVPEELCRHIGREIAKGLVAIHEAGVIHRDLKPENVLITEDHVVKVMDLGVARLQDEVVRLSQTGVFVGSLEYACPEQFQSGADNVDARSDLHALGVMLYELSTGKHPYRSDDVSSMLRNVIEGDARRAGEVNPQLSPFFEEVIHTLTAKEPGERFSSASTLLTVLDDGEKSEWWRRRAMALRVLTKRPLRRIRIPRETALYGRGEDLARLRALYEKAKDGDGQVLLIEGEAGIGKTRLVDEFVGRLRQAGEDINFLFGSYPPGGAATTAGAFSAAYREQLGAEGLEDTLQDYLKPTPVLIPSFAALLRGEPTPEGAEALTKDSLQTVFVHATRGLAAERPTIVLIDDLHFAPEDGRALFSSLAMALPGHRILLLGTMRPGVPGAWTANVARLEHAEQRSLSRLGPKDLTNLLRDAFRSERLAEELAFRIAQKSDGNPFFAFEIIRGLREGQFIAQQPDGTWVTTKIIQDIQVPSSVLELVNARVADLSEEERDLLDVAACCGFEFDPVLVADTLGLGQIPALKRFARIEKKHRLVRSSGANYTFDHHQVQEALYEGLHEKLRQPYHAAIAEALEVRVGAGDREADDLDGSLCVDLCDHFLEGAQGERALRYLDAALNHLEAGSRSAQAIALADRALSVPDLLQGDARLEVQFRRANRLSLLGRRAKQEEALAEARALAEIQGDQISMARAEQALGRLRRSTGRFEEAKRHFEKSLAISGAIGDRQAEALATGSLGVVLQSLSRYAEARTYSERSLGISREIGDRRAEARAEGNIGNVLLSIGRYEDAKRQYERSLAISREIGDRQAVANATGNLGNVLLSIGSCEEAREQYERSLAISHEIGDRQAEAIATGNLGSVFISLGCYEEARAHFEQSLAISREVGDRQTEASATGNLGNVLCSLARYEEAKKHQERHIAVSREIGDRQAEGIATGNLGNVLFSLARHEEARAHFERSLAICREVGDRWGEGYALFSLASVVHEGAGGDRALPLADEALALRREMGHAEGVADSLVQLGELHLREGSDDRGLEALREAVDLLRTQSRGTELAWALALLACLPGGGVEPALAALRDAGDSGSTPQVRFFLWRATQDPIHLEEAKRLLDDRIEHAPEENRESMRNNVRLNREIMEAWERHGGEGK